jgi:outer membrane protein TolC
MWHVRFGSHLIVILSAILALSGCAMQNASETAPLLEESLPANTGIPGDWTATQWDTGSVDDAWIDSFGDSELTALVDEAIANNLNLQAMSAQVDRAAGVVELAVAGLKPLVTAGAGSTRTGGANMPTSLEQDVGIAISWEADVWGRVRAGVDAAR